MSGNIPVQIMVPFIRPEIFPQSIITTITQSILEIPLQVVYHHTCPGVLEVV
jgi:hypothetical protein